jgi:hypothetical protein
MHQACTDSARNYMWIGWTLTKFKAEHPNLSFIVPKPRSHCGHEWCHYQTYRVISDSGAEQVIEVQVVEDSGFARKTWSRYRATHSDITPMFLRKVGGMDVSHGMYVLFCSLVIYVIGKLLRKITKKGVEGTSPVGRP